MPAWRVRVMPVSGAQHAWLHEMLQAAVHSIYSRDGSGPTSSGRCGGGSSFFSGSFSGQSPQNFDPPLTMSARSARGDLAGPDRRHGRRHAQVAERTLAVGIGAAADEAAVAEEHHRAPRPGAGETGGEVVQGHGFVNSKAPFANANVLQRSWEPGGYFLVSFFT